MYLAIRRERKRMPKLTLLLILILLSVSLVPATFAQDANPCDPTILAADYSARLASATSLDEIATIQADLGAILAMCNPTGAIPVAGDALVFEGSGNGKFGPISLAEGWYVFDYEFTTSGAPEYQFVDIDFLDGNKRFKFTDEQHFADEWHNTTIVQVEEGNYAADVQVNGTSNWQITIAAVDINTPAPVMTVTTAGGQGTLGPLHLNAGTYLVEYNVTVNEDAPTNLFKYPGVEIEILSTANESFQPIFEEDRDFNSIEGGVLLTVGGGIYFLNINPNVASQASVTVTPQ